MFIPPPSLNGVSPSTIPPDAPSAITLLGNFPETPTSVTVGGTAATSIVKVSQSQVTCTAPAKAAASYDVVVTAPAGSDTLVAGLTYGTSGSGDIFDNNEPYHAMEPQFDPVNDFLILPKNYAGGVTSWNFDTLPNGTAYSTNAEITAYKNANATSEHPVLSWKGVAEQPTIVTPGYGGSSKALGAIWPPYDGSQSTSIPLRTFPDTSPLYPDAHPARLVLQIMLRAEPAGWATAGSKGTEWWHWPNGSGNVGRIQGGFVKNSSGPSLWSWSADPQNRPAVPSPEPTNALNAPRWSDFNEGNFHRNTQVYQPLSVDDATDGEALRFMSGQLINAIGAWGQTQGFCDADDVLSLGHYPIKYLEFPGPLVGSYQTGGYVYGVIRWFVDRTP